MIDNYNGFFFSWNSNQRWGTWNVREYKEVSTLAAASLWLHEHQVIRNAALGAWGEGSDLILEARCVLSTIDAVKRR